MPLPSRLPRVVLETPPLPCMVPDGVFDAFAWCASDTLLVVGGVLGPAGVDESAGHPAAPFGENPAGMLFVFHAPCTFLPKEGARWHAPGVGFEDEEALAPYAIDEATDRLHETVTRPRDLLWLFAPGLSRLFWGLHDWAHFHNHGPFEQRAFTELQCDGTALGWLGRNREALGLDEVRLAALRADVIRLACRRFDEEAPHGTTPEAAEVARVIDALTTAAR